MVEGIQSVFEQTFDSWELLLVDDGSRDGSSALALTCEGEHPEKVRYFRHAGGVTLGPGPSRNLAAKHARGEFLAFLDIDDVWLPDKLNHQVRILDAYPETAMTYGPYFLWHGWTGIPADIARDSCYQIGNASIRDRVLPPPGLLERYLETGAGLPCPIQAMVRKAAFDAIGGFEPAFPGMYDDEALFLKIMLNYSVFISSQSLERYRQHPNSFSERAIRDGRWSRDPSFVSTDKVRLDAFTEHYISSRNDIVGKTKLLDILRRARLTASPSIANPAPRD